MWSEQPYPSPLDLSARLYQIWEEQHPILIFDKATVAEEDGGHGTLHIVGDHLILEWSAWVQSEEAEGSERGSESGRRADEHAGQPAQGGRSLAGGGQDVEEDIALYADCHIFTN